MVVQSENIDKLESIRELPDGWNGSDAKAFPPSLIEKVRGIIKKQEIQPEVFPTALGTIQLEYENSHKDHMEIEIGETPDAKVFIQKTDGFESRKTVSSDSDSINRIIKDFYC